MTQLYHLRLQTLKMESGKMFRFESCWVAVCLLSMCSGFVPESYDLRVDKSCNLETFDGCKGIPNDHLYSSPGKRGFEDDIDIYERLWITNLDIAEKTLNLPFLQHMKLGDLQSDDYVNFMIQDINYLLKVTDMLEEMTKKPIDDKELKQFFQDRFKSYREFSNLMLDQFNLRGVSEIKPIPAMQKYLSDYKTILDTEEPIYFAVSLLPCSRLWLWLANQLPIGYGNAYFIWKKNNMHGNPAKHYQKLLDDRLKTDAQKKKANEIFRQQMQNEHDFFAAAPKE
ncbi:uncharacterized protein PAE49_016952 isoform 2-T2 [Odontesthes bonariensis]|uniref:uncharacterized protein LOC142399957 isoform X2 n=1 Tax=Odontesthes bonariensis TaxID=219752 RepID=UPI003F583E13